MILELRDPKAGKFDFDGTFGRLGRRAAMLGILGLGASLLPIGCWLGNQGGYYILPAVFLCAAGWAFWHYPIILCLADKEWRPWGKPALRATRLGRVADIALQTVTALVLPVGILVLVFGPGMWKIMGLTLLLSSFFTSLAILRHWGFLKGKKSWEITS